MSLAAFASQLPYNVMGKAEAAAPSPRTPIPNVG